MAFGRLPVAWSKATCVEDIVRGQGPLPSPEVPSLGKAASARSLHTYLDPVTHDTLPPTLLRPFGKLPTSLRKS